MILSSFRGDGYLKLNSAWQTVLSYSREEENAKEEAQEEEGEIKLPLTVKIKHTKYN